MIELESTGARRRDGYQNKVTHFREVGRDESPQVCFKIYQGNKVVWLDSEEWRETRQRDGPAQLGEIGEKKYQMDAVFHQCWS